MRVDTQKVLNIVFSPFDRAFAVLGTDGWIGRYALPSFKMILKATLPDTKLDKWKSYRDIVFLPDTKEAQKNDGEMQLCVVGTDGEQQRLKIINQQNKVIRHQNYIHDAGELKKVLYVKTPVLGSRQLAGFVSGSDSG